MSWQETPERHNESAAPLCGVALGWWPGRASYKAQSEAQVKLAEDGYCPKIGRHNGRCWQHQSLTDFDVASREKQRLKSMAEHSARQEAERDRAQRPIVAHAVWHYCRPMPGMDFVEWQTIAAYRGYSWLPRIRALCDEVAMMERELAQTSNENLRDLLERFAGQWCAICGSSRATVNDHCHKTGLLRGVLCRICNSESHPRFSDYERLPPSVLCGATRPYVDPYRGRASVEPWVEQRLGPMPDSPAGRALYLVQAVPLHFDPSKGCESEPA